MSKNKGGAAALQSAFDTLLGDLKSFADLAGLDAHAGNGNGNGNGHKNGASKTAPAASETAAVAVAAAPEAPAMKRVRTSPRYGAGRASVAQAAKAAAAAPAPKKGKQAKAEAPAKPKVIVHKPVVQTRASSDYGHGIDRPGKPVTNPHNPTQVWSGIGRPPMWYIKAVREEGFVFDKEAGQLTKPARKRARKTATA